MKKYLLIGLVILQIGILKGQNSAEKELWFCSNQITNYESDGVWYSDTTNYFSSVLWFDSLNINLITFTYNDNDSISSIQTDTIKINYTIKNNYEIHGRYKDKTVSGNLSNGMMNLAFGENKDKIELIFLQTTKKKYALDSNINDETITKVLTSTKWKTDIDGLKVIVDFLPNHKYVMSSWSAPQTWQLLKISDYYFIMINDFMNSGVLLIKNISADSFSVDIFAKQSTKSILFEKK
jgi:hypothetical protein